MRENRQFNIEQRERTEYNQPSIKSDVLFIEGDEG